MLENCLIIILLISLFINAICIVFILLINEWWYKLYNEIIDTFYDDVIEILDNDE